MTDHELVRFGVSIGKGLLDKFDVLIETQGYTNRSEAIRDLIRDRLVEVEAQNRTDAMKAIGTITIVYDHHTREIGDRLTDIAHDHHELILSSIHIHLTEASCLEVILVKGCGKEIRKLADRFSSIKGVKHGKLVLTGLVEDDL
ncbi:MAG: nickel-responsive transcriptional regulator NikR [Candidatus Latescibacterota bacterium]